MADISNPHDRFFKVVFGRTEIAEDFLRNPPTPDIAALIHPGSLLGISQGKLAVLRRQLTRRFGLAETSF